MSTYALRRSNFGIAVVRRLMMTGTCWEHSVNFFPPVSWRWITKKDGSTVSTCWKMPKFQMWWRTYRKHTSETVFIHESCRRVSGSNSEPTFAVISKYWTISTSFWRFWVGSKDLKKFRRKHEEMERKSWKSGTWGLWTTKPRVSNAIY